MEIVLLARAKPGVKGVRLETNLLVLLLQVVKFLYLQIMQDVEITPFAAGPHLLTILFVQVTQIVLVVMQA